MRLLADEPRDIPLQGLEQWISRNKNLMIIIFFEINIIFKNTRMVGYPFINLIISFYSWKKNMTIYRNLMFIYIHYQGTQKSKCLSQCKPLLWHELIHVYFYFPKKFKRWKNTFVIASCLPIYTSWCYLYMLMSIAMHYIFLIMNIWSFKIIV